MKIMQNMQNNQWKEEKSVPEDLGREGEERGEEGEDKKEKGRKERENGGKGERRRRWGRKEGWLGF